MEHRMENEMETRIIEWLMGHYGLPNHLPLYNTTPRTNEG